VTGTPPPFIERKTRTSRASAAIAASLLLTTLFGAAQAIVLVAIVGQGERSDAFFAAYSMYLPLVLWAASLRASVVPLVLLPGDSPDDVRRAHASGVVARVIGIGAMASGAVLLLSPAIALALGHGLTGAGRRLLLECVAVLVVAGFLHFCAAALSAVLTAGRRFAFSALAYAGGSALALGIAAALLPAVGSLGSAVGLLCGAATVAAAHVLYARRLGVVLRVTVRGLLRSGGRRLLLKVVAGGALLGAQQIELAITLSLLSPTRGAITSFTYAFLLINLLLNLSFSPLSLALMPGLIESISETGPQAARAQLVRITRVASWVLIPALLALVAFADPLVPRIVEHLFTSGGADRLVAMIRILALAAIPAAFFVVSGNAILALQRWRRVTWVAALGILVHAAVVVPFSGLGPDAITFAHAGAMVIVAGLVVRATFDSGAWRTVGAALVRIAPAAATGLVFVAARLVVGATPTVEAAVAALLVSGVAYLCFVVAVRMDLMSRLRSRALERPSR
jgi:peptidoglycan biosynthesis protein MviN/MurJ (putative lipid II flippase)